MKEILVVDDSATMRQLTKMLLSKQPSFKVVEAADGLDALDLMRRRSFDLLVTDINMPRMDGLKLIQAVRQDLGLQVPIIVVTTKGGEADRDRGLELGANTYLTKPISGHQVLKAVTDLIGT